MKVIQRLKLSWKRAISAGKIIKLSGVSDVPVRSVICFADEYLGVVKSDEKWYGFQQEEKVFRFSLSSKRRTSENFICRGGFHLWNKVIRILTSVFLDREGSFSYSRPNSRGPWPVNFVKYCNRVINSSPVRHSSGYSSLDDLKERLFYIKDVVQTKLSGLLFVANGDNNRAVSREKLRKLWSENRKKVIRIVKSGSVFERPIFPGIDKQRIETYFDARFTGTATELINFVINVENGNDSEVPSFTAGEIKNVLLSMRRGSTPGKDDARYEDIIKKWEQVKNDFEDIFNIVLYYKRVLKGWKHELVRRIPKKNYDPDDLSTLRDISLLPCLYKLFIKCLLERIKSTVINMSISYWQRAYIAKRDRQELIICMKTAIDDFKHRRSKFYACFIDFKDAFGSLDHRFLITSLLKSGIEHTYCRIIADIYEDSHIEVICREGLSKEFLRTVGCKTGGPGSPIYFIIGLNRLLRGVLHSALLELNISNERRLAPIPWLQLPMM